ncbi:MAG: hypothetical protein DRP65_09075 [Planctomycetota bacterium]|nr:MAG: hypothetical protein DRP65_09075 [Planctomycetota bacterium]
MWRLFRRIFGVALLRHITDCEDRAGCVLFRDGAGAVVVECSRKGPL